MSEERILSHSDAEIEKLQRVTAHLKEQIDEIKKRNLKVEVAKAWEVSWTRKIAIVVLTYFVMVFLFHSLGNDAYWENALVPTTGFYLSTLSISVIKKLWMKVNKL